ncbi:hypothetical protein HK103_005575 [Boothiomyces macroporosus]|uniref:C2H2-type domain-containing protein n=1 Tax=Boothiomyces macroporosus TaxID=261099 RepID=A0AAD5UIU0_9FUNG|nr:hypothetical protein HK103_005575 [Boothiomyces macroporosus]
MSVQSLFLQQQEPENMNFLLQKLNNLPAPDFSNGIDIQDLQMDPFPVKIQQAGLDGYEMKMAPQAYYPTMLSPPDSPQNNQVQQQQPMRMSPPMQYANPQWPPVRNRSESVIWNPMEEQQQPQMTHSRSMSLPHLMAPLSHQGDYPLLQMNFGLQEDKFMPMRKNSISSTGSEKTFTCTHPTCDRTFSRIQNLRSHMRCHLLTTPHTCKTCGLGFRRTTDLQRHIRTMHTPNDQKPWACPKCPKRFGRSDALKRHMTSRSKDHGCPSGPDMELLRKMEEQKRMKSAKQALATVVEGTMF